MNDLVTTPAVEQKRYAYTTTRTEQRVPIWICKIESEDEHGWYVYGYRLRRGALKGHVALNGQPRLYFIPRADSYFAQRSES